MHIYSLLKYQASWGKDLPIFLWENNAQNCNFNFKKEKYFNVTTSSFQ